MSKPYYSAAEVVRAAAWQREQVKSALGVANVIDGQHRDAVARVKTELDTATKELAESLLPSLAPEAISRAVARTAYTPLSDVPARVETERAALKAQLASLEHDPRFVQRELLRHPRTGTLPNKLRELDELTRPWASFVSTCEHPRLERLLESGWGTPEYAGAWWRVSYWKDHSAAADLLALFPELADFAALRGELLKGRDALAKLGAERTRLANEVVAGERVEAEHARLAEALWTLDARWLQSSREALLRHVATTPPALLEPRLAAEPNLRVMALRAAGLGAKLGYLDGLHREKVGRMVQDLHTTDAKMAQVEARYRRKPVNMRGDEFERKFVDRAPRYQKSFDRYRSLSSRIYAFDRWHTAPTFSDYLWWDVMMRGRVDGTFLPEVSGYYRAHPGYRYVAPVARERGDDVDTDVDAAATAASSGADDHAAPGRADAS